MSASGDIYLTPQEIRRRAKRVPARPAAIAKRNRLVGRVFGRLTVEARYSGSYWACRCVCSVELYVIGGDLTSGHTQSCGCLRREKLRATRVPLSEVTRQKIRVARAKQDRAALSAAATRREAAKRIRACA